MKEIDRTAMLELLRHEINRMAIPEKIADEISKHDPLRSFFRFGKLPVETPPGNFTFVAPQINKLPENDIGKANSYSYSLEEWRPFDAPYNLNNTKILLEVSCDALRKRMDEVVNFARRELHEVIHAGLRYELYSRCVFKAHVNLAGEEGQIDAPWPKITANPGFLSCEWKEELRELLQKETGGDWHEIKDGHPEMRFIMGQNQDALPVEPYVFKATTDGEERVDNPLWEDAPYHLVLFGTGDPVFEYQSHAGNLLGIQIIVSGECDLANNMFSDFARLRYRVIRAMCPIYPGACCAVIARRWNH